MSRFFTRISLALLVLSQAAVPRTSAEPIQWSYQGQVVTTGFSRGYNGEPLGPHILVVAERYNSPALGGPGIVYDPSSYVQFADVAGVGSGSNSVTAFQLRVTDSLLGYHYSKDLHTFNLSFAIRDAASGATGSASFKGGLYNFTDVGADHRTGALIGVAFDLYAEFSGPTQKSFVLGNHLYKVSIDPFHHQFLWYADSPSGLVRPVVSPYQDVPIHVQVSDVPEPSTLALAAAGLAGLGLRSWRRRRVSQSPV